jgi:chromosome segregation ATPase
LTINRNAEQDVLKIIKAAETDHITSPTMIAELNRKISSANQERDEAERMFESQRSTMKRLTLQWEQEREQLNTQITETMKRLYKAEKDLQEERDSNKRIAKELDIVQKKLQNCEFEKQDQDRSYRDRILEMTETHKLQVKDLQRRLQESSEKYMNNEREVQQLQLKLEELELRLKKESKKSLDQSERIIKDLKNENERLIRRNSDLSEKVTSIVKERAEIMRDKDELEESIGRLRKQYESTKMRAEHNGNQIKLLLEKEAELLRERKDLHLQVDRKNLEVERLHREKDAIAKKLSEQERDNLHTNSILNLYPYDDIALEERLFMSVPSRQGTSLPRASRKKQYRRKKADASEVQSASSTGIDD